MALANITDLATLTGQVFTSLPQAEQDRLTLCLDAADRAVKNYLARGKMLGLVDWPEQTTATFYMTGNNRNRLPLRYFPVQSLTAVAESPTGYFGAGDASSWVTLVAGTDYVLEIDEGTTQSASAVLIRLGGPGASSVTGSYGWFPAGGWAAGGTGWPDGTLSGGRSGPVWPSYAGGLKITGTFGYAQPYPKDLSMAVLQMALAIKRLSPLGGVGLQSEHLADYQYTIAAQQLNAAPELGGLRQLLSRYRCRPALG